MKQQCSMAFIYLSWALYLGGIAFFAVRGDLLMAAVSLGVLPLGQLGYVRYFPLLSRFLGYGSVQDRPAGALAPAKPTRVTLYTAFGCPFCPIVKRRLEALQGRLGFELVGVDVTARLDLLTAKGIRSVPVVEVGEALVVGNATSEQLARLVTGGARSQLDS